MAGRKSRTEDNEHSDPDASVAITYLMHGDHVLHSGVRTLAIREYSTLYGIRLLASAAPARPGLARRENERAGLPGVDGEAAEAEAVEAGRNRLGDHTGDL